MISFFVPGIPAPQGSKRHVGNGRLVESSKLLPAWREAVRIAAQQAAGSNPPIDAPVHVTARFFMPKPKRPRFNTPAVAPDLDKLQRAVGDGLEAGGLIKNDSRIISWDSTKHYAGEHQQPGVHIHITDQFLIGEAA